MLRQLERDLIAVGVREIKIHHQDRGAKFNGLGKGRCAGIGSARVAVAR